MYEKVKAAAKKPLARFKYPNEAALVERGDFRGGAGKSVLFFTVQKCASTFIPFAFRALKEFGAPQMYYDLAVYLIHTRSEPVYQFLGNNAVKLFRSEGAIYAPLREWIEIPNLDDYEILLMLRDPRDVLVSNYYSVLQTHPLPGSKTHREEMLERRKIARGQTVDEYVLANKNRFYERYLLYYEHLMQRENVTFLTYEMMTMNFDQWASDFISAAGLEATPERLSTLNTIRGTDPGSDQREDLDNHRRHGLPGEYKVKLTTETQRELNSHFAPILNDYGVWGDVR